MGFINIMYMINVALRYNPAPGILPASPRS
jgi:hypothetical protein